jgi:prepilin-type N-terminal cleavage/methylation domain-containing protein
MKRPGFTLVELLVCLSIGLLLVSLVNWTFQGLALLVYAEAFCVGLALLAAVRLEWKAMAAACMPAAFVAVPLVGMLPTALPTHFARVEGAEFRAAPLEQVLEHLAAQHPGDPYWRFELSAAELANLPTTVVIPSGCRLGRALELVASAAGCEYDWHWFKGCGNAPSPLRAGFRFWPEGQRPEGYPRPEVIVRAQMEVE